MGLIDPVAQIEVELDIFSGRPNPHWTLADERAREVAAVIPDGSQSAAEWHEPPGLGYRGFVLTTAKSRMRVFAGMLAVSQGERTEYQGSAQRLEEILLQQARDHGFGEVLAAFGASGRAEASA